MPDPFNANIQKTIERCRRLASTTHDQEVAQQLLELAAKLEASLPRAAADRSDDDIA